MKNHHIEEFILRYIGSEPEAAILVSGRWGSGKTYLVRKTVKKKTHEFLHVSLAGVRSTDEIVKLLYAEAFPALENKSLKVMGSLAKSLAGVVRFKSELKSTDLFDLDRYEIMIFDDLERSELTTKEMLGFINRFVEHDKCRVILIGNEDELEKDPTFKNTKEKVVGFTLTVEPDSEPVVELQAEEIGGSTGKFISSRLESITSIVDEIETSNLRVIKFALKDLKKPYEQLEQAGIEDDAKEGFLFPFFIINIAYRLGEIDREHIKKRTVDDYTRAFLQHSEKYEPDNFEKVDQRVQSIDLYTPTLDNDYLEAAICDGRHDCELLQRTIADFLGRSDPSANLEWRNLWYLIHQKEEVVTQSMERLATKVSDREYEEPGEILHVLGIYLRLKKAKLISCTKARIFSEFTRYISDLKEADKLPIWHNDHDLSLRMGSAYGLGFVESDDPTFSKAYNHFKKESEKELDKKVIQSIKDAFSRKVIDDDELRVLILQADHKYNAYAKPYLGKVDANFVGQSILNQEGDVRFKILNTLGSRYYQNPNREVVDGESKWVRRLITALKRGARSETKIEQYRLQEVLSWRLDDVAKKFANENSGTP